MQTHSSHTQAKQINRCIMRMTQPKCAQLCQTREEMTLHFTFYRVTFDLLTLKKLFTFFTLLPFLPFTFDLYLDLCLHLNLNLHLYLYSLLYLYVCLSLPSPPVPCAALRRFTWPALPCASLSFTPLHSGKTCGGRKQNKIKFES